MAWCIYYGDGSTYSSEDGDSPPARGVQVILQDDPSVGVAAVTGLDYYVRDGERWRPVDIFGLYDFLLDTGLVLFGRTITSEEYREVMRQAMADKTGWTVFERKPE